MANHGVKNYTYILRCGDGSLYTGWTNDLDQRVKAHQSGKGAKYTKSHAPVELVYYEVFSTKGEAMRREAYIKRLTREKKLLLMEGEEATKDDWTILETWKIER